MAQMVSAIPHTVRCSANNGCNDSLKGLISIGVNIDLIHPVDLNSFLQRAGPMAPTFAAHPELQSFNCHSVPDS